MAERVFCIDFGSAFTKVALRRDPGADSQLLTPQGGVDDAAFCISSTIAVDRRGTKPVAEFGARAADLRPGGGIDVHRNWKRSIFFTPAAGKPHQSPLEALLQSDELRVLATRYGVAVGQIGYLQQLVGAAKALIAGPGGRGISAEAQQQTFASVLAAHFFHWLRQQVMTACGRLPGTGLKYEDIPVRITVPAFALTKEGDPHPGCKALTDALGKAGWPLHPDRPVVSEPYANAVGVLTKAHNVIHRSRAQLGQMFSKGPLITVLKDPAHHPAYRALVIDVGAFTTDFADVAVRPDGETIENPDVAFTVRQQSVPLGVSDLDAKVIEALPKEKGEWLRDKAPALDWEDFRRAVYSEGKGFRKAEIGLIGGPSDADAIRDCLQAFVQQLTTEAFKFCEGLDSAGMQELILTGGGNFIPTVRDAVQQACQRNGQCFAKVHAPGLKRVAGSATLANKLDETFTRGATALGGASVYFEKDFY
ncbi:MAG TPA: hypothetical protein VKE74_13635 [Gemmataceae bacterium]|nr:hypothetical protein [Gemmataceae bacterium]